jgi:GNAT superfamily N-acetyltransferase
MLSVKTDKVAEDPLKDKLAGRAFKIEEITKLYDKVNWIKRFKLNYSGKVTIDSKIYGSGCRYFVAILDGKEVGFIRITNYTEMWAHVYNGIVWSASDAYVKKQYRNQHVLRRLLKYVIDHCHVKSAFIEVELYAAYYSYYRTLGFTNLLYGRDDWLVHIVQNDVFESVKSRASASVNTH